METDYTNFGTYLCLLFHIVVFDIKALVVPWHQFVYSLFIPCGHLVIQPASFRSSSFVKFLPASCSFIFGNRKSPTVPGPDCTEDAQRCPKGIAHAARLVSAGQYPDVHCCATEQFHVRTCLFSKITLKYHCPAKMNNTSHLTVDRILNRHSHAHNYLALTMLQGRHFHDTRAAMLGGVMVYVVAWPETHVI